MILTLPVPYRAEVTLPGKRNSDAAHLIVQVPMRITEAPVDDLKLVARLGITVNTRDPVGDGFIQRTEHIPFYQHGDTLLTTFRKPRLYSSPVGYPSTDVTAVGDLKLSLYGSPFTHCIRGEPLGGDLYDSKGAHHAAINPFARPVTMVGSEIQTVLDEGVELKSRVIRSGERDEAIAHALDAASRCLIVDGQLLYPSNGPTLRPLRSSLEVQLLETGGYVDGYQVRNPFLAWNNCWGAANLEQLVATLESKGWSGKTNHDLEVFDSEALSRLVDSHALRLVAAAEMQIHRTPHMASEQDEMWGWSRERGKGWFDLREVVRDHRIGQATPEDIAVAAAAMAAAPDADHRLKALGELVRDFQRSRIGLEMEPDLTPAGPTR